MFAQPSLEQHQVDPVARGMLPRNAIPAAMFHGDARFRADPFEPHLNFGCLIRASSERASRRRAAAGLPVAHGPDFPFFAIVEARDEAAAWPGGIKAQRAIALGESGKSGWLFHHRPMPSVKAANATSGEAATRRATMTAALIRRLRHDA
jgi:hypothetical protein